MTYPLTVSMTPAFMYEGDWLFRAQLRCLSEQTNKDFDVYVIDHHYHKRKGYMKELAEKYRLNIVHTPYTPNTHIAKRLDCAIFNAPYCYSESPRIVRFSDWRFVRPDWTDICINSPTNVDFYFHSIEAPSFELLNEVTNHNTAIWNFGSDEVHWQNIPKCGEPGATWTSHSEQDAPAAVFPRNCYGNYMVFRDQWLSINGCDEVFTNVCHYEDMDFTIRAGNAGLMCARKSNKLYRLHHFYGGFSGRANIVPDVEFKKPCPSCMMAINVLEPKRFDLENRVAKGEIERIGLVWVCKTCSLSGAWYHKDCGEHTNAISGTQATILPKYKIGRNLRLLIADMDGKSIQEKVEVYNDSWTNEKYYQ